MSTPSVGANQPGGGDGVDAPYNRRIRFGDWTPVQDGEGSRILYFYQGEAVGNRMSSVRGAIVHVRESWGNYAMLMNELRRLLQEGVQEPLPSEDAQQLEDVLASVKEWIDRRAGPAQEEEDYNVVRLYTSTFGYRLIFKITDIIIRTDTGITQRQEELNSAVFLLELLNVDLFNYVSVTQPADDFQGVVFRALPASEEQLQSFRELATKPISERDWAIPLTVISTSRNQDVAMDYAKAEVARLPERQLFLWRIHVVGLDAELLRVYRERYPTSVVSTICAVPIDELSPFPEEEEVILRGPFFQLVQMQEEVLEGVGRVYVMDSVTVNVNRDHPSTMELGEDGNGARELISTLVSMARTKACQGLAEGYGLVADAESYQRLYEEMVERLG
ncbi:hypothetical protein H0H81_011361 [Sphagnurus paluster]|uniref:Uncharacterized protein n=1 Tax=Sphagnurus paluster TaxID=117069 RepID=A0A9P7GHF9_9AGAR|nr:hypothetical protein H0H81_011361 [Sphagnurus paluster]